MDRKKFIRTSAGLSAVLISPGVWTVFSPSGQKKYHYKFKSYRPDKTFGKVTQVTPEDGFYIHTFFDICPFSPSQNYLAVNRFPFQDRDPVLGDTVDVCIIDLENETIETVYTTKGWGVQIGANLNWGLTDRYLYTNDVIDNQGVCVRIDLEKNETKAFSGPMYHLAPDESCVIGFPLDLINATQRGYGVPETPLTKYLSPGTSVSEGLWRTDLKTNKKTLLLSLSEMEKHVPERNQLTGGTYYFFHSKFNRQNNRIMQVVRYLVEDGEKKQRNPMVFTFKVDATDIQEAVTLEQWSHGGHHPNWHPDGEHLIMNLSLEKGQPLRFCQVRYDGSEFKVLSEKYVGSGHPSITPDGKYMLTDSYVNKKFADEKDEVPIRLIDLDAQEETEICRIYTLGPNLKTLRCDPHPAWDRSFSKVCFNGAPNGARQVFIAELSNEI